MTRAVAGRCLRWVRLPCLHEWLLIAVLLGMTHRYLWLMDDSFVYFRYADNALFLDRGLVYNAGEYVEGYSSPLWMLLLLACRASELDYYSLVRCLALVCAASYGLALVWVNRRMTMPVLRPVINFPLAASAAHYGITTHFSSGLETPLVQLCAPLYAAALLRPSCGLLQLTMGLVPLVRAECGLLWLGYLPWVWLRTRRVPWLFLWSAGLANGAWLCFRVWYYADLLPNTFYLKDVAQWGLGWEYLYNVSETHHWPWVLFGLACCALLGRRYLARAQLAPRAILLSSALAYALYVARIGGDMLYHRYAALPVCLLLCASAGVVEAAVLPRVPVVPPLARRMVAAYCASALCGAFGAAYPRQLDTHPFWFAENLHNWRAVSDASWHRHHEDLRYSVKRREEDAVQRAAYARLRARGELKDPPIFVEGFCRTGYKRIAGYVINDYGLTDAVLARLPRPFGRPGHKFVQQEAQDLKALRLAARRRPQLRWYQFAQAPAWVKKNQQGLAELEQKQGNSHVFQANFALAVQPVHLE